MKLKHLTLAIMLSSAHTGWAQSDSTKLFENSKGRLSYPIHTPDNRLKIQKGDDSNSMYFTTDSAYSVHAIYGGTVISVTLIDDFYVVISRFGNYFITYAGLVKPCVISGDIIKGDQKISNLAETPEHNFELTLVISTQSKNTDPAIWFRKKNK